MIIQKANDISIKKVISPGELNDVFRLRYWVYCLERGYEKPDDHPQGLEIDDYDPYSIHFLAYIGSSPVGTVRLILPNSIGFPVEKYCNIKLNTISPDIFKFAEISRLAVSSGMSKKYSIQRSGLTLALLKELYHTARQYEIRFLVAAMSTGLDRLLQRCGIKFIQAGNPVEYHGLRIPYFAHMEHLEGEVFAQKKDIYQFFFPTSNFSTN